MDIDLARRAIRNQKTYYRQRDSAGDWIDYNKVINGELHLVPEGEPYEQLRYDYAEMTETGAFCKTQANSSSDIASLHDDWILVSTLHDSLDLAAKFRPDSTKNPFKPSKRV